MKSAATNKSSANQQPATTYGSKTPSRGTSSFSSKVPRFPEEKITFGPSPSQYDPIVKEKIKGVVPLSKQLPRTTDHTIRGESSKSARKNSAIRSNQSSASSFHSTRERSSSGSAYSGTRVSTPVNTTRASVQPPFAPLKRTGIVKTTTATATTTTTTRPRPATSTQPTTLRSNTYETITTKVTASKPASRLTSGNPVPGSTIVWKPPARPATAGSTCGARTGPTIVRSGNQLHPGILRPTSRAASPAGKRRTPSPAVRPRTANSPAARKQSPSRREETRQIKKELDELMVQKQAQSSAAKKSRENSPSGGTTSSRTRSSSYSRSSRRSGGSQTLSASSSRTTTTTTMDYSSQDDDEEDVEGGGMTGQRHRKTWSTSSDSQVSLGASPPQPPSPPTPIKKETSEVADAETRTRRASNNSNHSDRTTISWMDKEAAAAAVKEEPPPQELSLTYIVDAEPLRSPLMSCVRRYFTHESDVATAKEGASEALKPFKDMPQQNAYVSKMYDVFAAGVKATSPPTMGDHLLAMGGYHPLSSSIRPTQEVNALSICELQPVAAPPPTRMPPAGGGRLTKPCKEPLLHSRQTPLKTGEAKAAPKQQVGPKARAGTTKTRAAQSPRRVNETESFPRAEMKRKCSPSAHSFTNSPTDVPVILHNGNKYYLPMRNYLPKPPPSVVARCPRTLSPTAPHPKRARTAEPPIERGERNRPRVTFKPRSLSAPTEAEKCVATPKQTTTTTTTATAAAMEVPLSDEEAEVEIASTNYEEDAPSRRRSRHRLPDTAEQNEEIEDGASMSTVAEINYGSFDIDVVCSDNNLTIIAMDKRPPKSVEKLKTANNKQKDHQQQMKKVETEFRSCDKRSRSKSSNRRAANSKSKSSPRSTSLCESEKLSCGKSQDQLMIRSVNSSVSDLLPDSQSQLRSQSESSCAHDKDRIEKRSAENDPQTKVTQTAKDKLTGKQEQHVKEEKPNSHSKSIDIQLPKLDVEMQTSGNKPAVQYVRESIVLLDAIPLTAQKISEAFHKILEGMRSYVTDAPYINLRRNELHEQMMAYINEADGNAFYIRQEVKTDLHRCVTQINANLQELLYLNNCVLEERQVYQKRIDELYKREEQLTGGMDEYKRLNENVQMKCDDWAYRYRKEQETRRFIEGSKEMVEKDLCKHRKELRGAEEEVGRLRREVTEFEKKLDELKKCSVQKDTRYQAKLRAEERTAQSTAEALTRVTDERNAMQRTLQQMNESHIQLNNQNMAKMQALEKLLRDSGDALAKERDEKRKVEAQLHKKDEYLKLVEGATVDLVRQTNPGRELPSMPEDFGLNEREVAVWEQLNLCRARLAELETENQILQQERLMLIEKNNDMEQIYHWVQENEDLLKANQNEFTILEQPNAELVEEMEEMRKENKDLKDRLAAREKHCSLAHEKIEKLQDLLNSLRISETEDADRVQVATLQHQITEMKGSMREMLERTKELDLLCASQEIQLKQRDYYARNQQRLLETRNQVIDVLKCKGRDVSTLESLMGFGDTWRKNNEPRRSMSGTSEDRELRRSPSQLAKNELRIAELEELVVKLENDETTNHEQRRQLENTIAELELKLLKAERAKYYRTSNTCLPTLT